MDELRYKYDGLGLAELVKTKQIHPKELVEASIQRIEHLNPTLNAVVYKMYEQALQAANGDRGEGPFAGVPVLLKDVHQEIQGEPTTYGSNVYRNSRANEDSHYTSRLREAGAIFVGYTNSPEFALMAVTEPRAYGPTRNPWNPEVTPGGSSGGAAAAVAAGMVPIAGASDGGGSIRIPAAYCGLFGLKPTRGRTPVGPQSGRHWQGASVSHGLTRSVRDSAALLDWLSISERAGAFAAPLQTRSYLDTVMRVENRPLRIAYSLTSPLGTHVDPEYQKAVMKSVHYLESIGHQVLEETAPVDGKQIASSYIKMYFAEMGAELKKMEGVLGRRAKRTDVEPTTWLLGTLGRSLSAADFVLSLQEWDKAARQMEQFHDTYDLYITPATAMPPAKIGELELKGMERLLTVLIDKFGLSKVFQKSGFVDTLVETSLKRTPFTQLANLTGQPAMSLPLYLTDYGVPAGVQVLARRGGEELLFQLAAVMEQSPLWVDVTDNPIYSKSSIN